MKISLKNSELILTQVQDSFNIQLIGFGLGKTISYLVNLTGSYPQSEESDYIFFSLWLSSYHKIQTIVLEIFRPCKDLSFFL